MLRNNSYLLLLLFFCFESKVSTAQYFVDVEGYLVVERFVYIPIKESDVVNFDFGITNVYYFEAMDKALENVEGTLNLSNDESLWDYKPEVSVEFFPIKKLKQQHFFGDSSLKKECMPYMREGSYMPIFYKELEKLDFGKKEAEKKRFYVFFRVKASVVSGQDLKKNLGKCNVYDYKEPPSKLEKSYCPYYYHDNSFEKLDYMFTVYRRLKK